MHKYFNLTEVIMILLFLIGIDLFTDSGWLATGLGAGLASLSLQTLIALMIIDERLSSEITVTVERDENTT